MNSLGLLRTTLRTLSVVLILAILVGSASGAQYGEFLGQVSVEWLDEDGQDRSMKLLERFRYKDMNAKVWTVPKGSVVDGASIPRFLWTPIGSPFVGDYRKASVVHDHYCDTKSERWEDVHEMFYYASLAGGVTEEKAKILYAGVYWGGPRWEYVPVTRLRCDEDGTCKMSEMYQLRTRQLKVDMSQFQEVKHWIVENNPSLKQITDRLDRLTKN